MEKTIFMGRMEGLVIDEVVRDHDFTMRTKHFHDTYELYFLMEGERYYFIDRETYRVKTGEVVLVNRQQLHQTGLADQPYHDRILLQMDGKILDPYLIRAGLFPLEKLFSDYYGVIRLPEEAWEEARTLLLSMRREMGERGERYETMIRLQLASLLLLIYRCRRAGLSFGEPETVQTPKHQKVHEVAEYLTSHCGTQESLESLAARFYVSKSYLSRIFREVTGCSVNEYKNLARIKKAENFLKNSAYSITEIAEILGFESVTYFERVFKKHVDMTPLRYRKSVQNLAGTAQIYPSRKSTEKLCEYT